MTWNSSGDSPRKRATSASSVGRRANRSGTKGSVVERRRPGGSLPNTPEWHPSRPATLDHMKVAEGMPRYRDSRTPREPD
jgi:hypothetical protein